MRTSKSVIYPLVLLFVLIFTQCQSARHANYVFSIRRERTYLNDREILLKGMRLSNALISETTVDEAIAHLDTFAAYGLNSFSVYFQGSRFGDVRGYREDGTLDPVYADRMSRLIEAADRNEGYMMASTWLQCVPPKGPNHRPGGYGTTDDPGIRWWLEAIRARYGAYTPPPRR